MKYKLISDYQYNPFDAQFFKKLIFKNRNVEPTKSFLAPTENNLHHWGLLDNIEEGVSLLSKHLNNNIFLIVDSDVDGYTSAAIFYNFLYEKTKGNININWMVHEERQHGIILESIPKDTDLLVVIDAGSNQYEEHEVLFNRGVDILIIDHHEASHYSKHAVVINNQLSDRYPNKNLSGVGMAYKFCCALTADIGTTIVDKYLDLVALGLIADMMDVTELENRYIIHHGLKNINNSFFKALIDKQRYSLGSQSINTIGVMFYIAPLINSLTRVGTKEEKELMFTAFIDGDKQVSCTKKGASSNSIETISEQAVRVCSNAKARQKRIADNLQLEIEQMLEDGDLLNKPLILITLKEKQNRNILGLVANQMAHKYKKPVLVLIPDKEESYSGSGRNYNLSEIESLKDILNKTELFEFAEGHQSAFGAKIKEKNIKEFLDYCSKNLPTTETMEVYPVDLIFTGNEISPIFIQQIGKLRPLWGKGFDEPSIVIEDIGVLPEDITVMGKGQNHIKFHKNGVDFVIFNVDVNEIKKSNLPLSFDIVGRCGINIWRDRISYQIIAQDYSVKQNESSFGF